MKKSLFLPLASFFLIAGLCLIGCEPTSPAEEKNYKVSFDLNGAAGSIATQTIAEGAKVAEPADPERDGFTFEGWYTDETTTQEYNFTTATVTANMILYAKWATDAVEAFTVSFNSNEGSAVESLTVNKDAKVDQPTDPEKDGYTFDGWYTDEATTLSYDFTTATVTANITLYAKWAAVETFTVSFNSNGGSAVESRTVNKDAKVDKPTDPEREDFIFVGWYTDETTTQEYNFTTATVTANMILYAKWAAAVANGFLIPDVNFRTHLKENIGEAFEGELMDTTHSSVLSLTSLDVSSKNISSLAGIEYFTALDTLSCHNNSLTTLDVTQNTALTTLRCNINSLTTLDVTQNTALTRLLCTNNSLTTLDVTQNTALTRLNCGDNQLTRLDVSNNTALTVLYCYGNELTTLDVTQNTALTVLDCGSNPLTTLDVTQNTALTELYCNTNSLTELDVRQNTALIYLYCDGNQLSSLDLRGRKSFIVLAIYAGTTTNPLTQLYVHTDLQTHDEVKKAKTNRGADVTISTYDDDNTLVCADFDPNEGEAGTCKDNTSVANGFLIPDVNFRTALKENVSAAFEGEYMDTTHSSVRGLTALDVAEKSISSLAGIEYFTMLTELRCNDNLLTALDVRQNTTLTHLYCNNNSLTVLDVRQNTALNLLVCSNNSLTELDVTQNTALTTLDCRSNSLTTLDVRQNTALINLNCNGNQLSSLDLRGRQRFLLLSINAGSTDDGGIATNPLEQLYVHTNLQTHAEIQEAKTNREAAVTISTYDDDNTLVCADFDPNEGEAGTCKDNTSVANGFLIPDVNFRTALKENVSAAFEGEYMDTTHSSVRGLTLLNVDSKNISSLAGIEYFTALTSLNCNDNLFTELDVTKNTALTSLNCANNSLTALDVKQNTALTLLFCNDNSLTVLDVAQNTALTRLVCTNNSLTTLDVTQNTALTSLYCSDNSLALLDVTQNTALAGLSCNNNELTTLDVTKNTALTTLRCNDNSLTALDVTKNTALTSLSCTNNSLTALDVRQNTVLTLLLCQGNQLSSLDLRGRRSFILLTINAGSTDAGTATNPLEQLYVHTDLQTHAEIQEAKTNREAAITISTYNDANERVCRDFDPTEGTAGTCKD